MRRRAWWYVVDPRRRSSAALARFPFRWLAALACRLIPGSDFEQPGRFLKGGGR